MPYRVNRDNINEGTKFTVSDLEIQIPIDTDGEVLFLSVAGELPSAVVDDFWFVTGSVGNKNRGVYVVRDVPPPTAFAVLAYKVDHRSTPAEPSGPQPGGQVWAHGEIFRNGPGSFPPSQTELDFEDVLLMILKNSPAGTGGVGGPD